MYVYGYTDRQGDHSYNMKLSVLHAESVGNYFMANGFPKDKVISGWLFQKPACPA
ncbi:OmpA family protein [Salmonella enterica]|nr:OmpA family protein [Salmonella enterica]